MEDDDVEIGPGRDIPTDGIPVNFVPAKAGETFKLGLITCRVLEDGSRTSKIPPMSPNELLCWSRQIGGTFQVAC